MREVRPIRWRTTGARDREEAALAIAAWGVKEIVLNASEPGPTREAPDRLQRCFLEGP